MTTASASAVLPSVLSSSNELIFHVTAIVEEMQVTTLA
jgi:hypothetical protein